MMQPFVDEVMENLTREADVLERGIHGAFPFGRRSVGRRSSRVRSPMLSPNRSSKLVNTVDAFTENEASLWFDAAEASDRATPPTGQRQRTSTRAFLSNALQRISNSQHPLHFLVVARRLPNGQVTYSWRRTTRITASGRRQTGRYDYQGHETGPIVQVGHQGAFAAGVPERLMLEDADLNQQSGRTIESRGAYSFKDAVVIGGVPVDVASAQQWERLGLLTQGTVARSPRIPAPMP